MRYLISLISLIALISGCGPSSTHEPMAPRVGQASIVSLQIGSPLADVTALGGVFERTTDHGSLYRLPDGTAVVVGPARTAFTYMRGTQLQSVSIGKITVVCICSYPLNFVGPLPSGYGYVDGSGCN